MIYIRAQVPFAKIERIAQEYFLFTAQEHQASYKTLERLM